MDVVDVAIDDLRPDSANPRRISSAQATALTRSLEKFGFVQPLLVRREDGTVIGGHQRLGAARRLGYKTVPVTYLGLMREQARVLNVGPNKISGEWDHEKLASMLADLTPVEDLDLTLTGFNPGELDKLMRSLDVRSKKERPEKFDLNVALEDACRLARVKAGEAWALGEHHLICGDASDAETVGRLLGERKAVAPYP